MSALAPVDVLIVTAIREERDAVKDVITGALGDSWSAEPAPSTGLRVERRTFRAANGSKLRVALICAEDMGGTQTAGVAGPVVMALRPRCLAMCGVLAGKPDDTEFGDVIFADQLLLHDSGKRTERAFEHATRPHTLDIRWLEKARDFAEDPQDARDWLADAAWSDEQQRAWLLDQFSRGRTRTSLARLLPECCPSYETIVAQLLTEGLVCSGDDPLTAAGKQHVAELRFRSLRWPGLARPRRSLAVHVGPIASGNAVQGDSALWKELSVFARKTLGVEMEAHAVANTAELHQVELAVVMKGVMDHADRHKDDRFKPFAARAAAECLLAFLRRYLPATTRHGHDDLLSPGTADLPADPAPSQLLHAIYEAVPFYEAGRASEMADLDAWCATGADVRGRLIHGPGGFGKTRLAIEWTRRLREQGWAAGFLHANVADDWFARLLAPGTRSAVVIDYAESRSDLQHLLAPVLHYAQAEGARTRVRVLLLARAAGDWWSALLARDERLRTFLVEVPAAPLGPLAEAPGTRIDVYRAAVTSFSSRRKQASPREQPEDLADAIFDRVLYLHMAALAAVDDLDLRTPRSCRPESEATLMEATLEHEERYWDERQVQSDRTRRIQTGRARQLVAAATLRGGLPTHGVATAVTSSVLGAPDEHLLMLLHDIYGTSDYVGRLEPDLLGEGMIRRTYGRKHECPEDYIDRVFSDDNATAIQTGFVVLGRTSSEMGSVRPWIDHLLAKKLNDRALLAFQAAKIVGKHTAFSDLGDALADALQLRGDANLAKAIERSEIPDKTVALRRVATWALQTRLNALPQVNDERVLQERARLLNNISHRQSQLGQREAALESAANAVHIYSELVSTNHDAFLPDLAASLTNLSNWQSALGQRNAALGSAEESLRIRRELVNKNHDKFLPDLATSLNNLGIAQSELGQRDAALLSAAEAVIIYQELAVANQEVFLPDLATNLNNLGIMQREVGQWDAALESTVEAVRIRRDLANKNPDAFLPDLAASLNNLGIRHNELGQSTAALEATAEAVRIRRELANKNPDAFLPDLASSLNNISNIQNALKLREAALESAVEAISIRRVLALKNSDAFLPDLAMSLNNLGNSQSTLGQLEAALDSATEAVSIYRRLADENDETFLPGLAISLNNLGATQNVLGQHGAALESAAEAFDIYWRFFVTHPVVFARYLGIALSNLIKRLRAARSAPNTELLERIAILREMGAVISLDGDPS